jgi:hypothetical protein
VRRHAGLGVAQHPLHRFDIRARSPPGSRRCAASRAA